MSFIPLTLVEKIASRYAVGLGPGRVVRSGDFVTIRPKHVMTHDNTGAVIPKFREIFKGAGDRAPGAGEGGRPRIHDPRQPVFAIDHDIQNQTPENLGKYAKIESFAAEHGVDFYPAGTGISHQVMVEQGYVTPGSMVVGSDSHSNLYGALACLGTPVVRTDAASLWATGVTWWQCPPVARVVLKGRLRAGVVGKDVIVALCGLFNQDQVLNHAVEFVSGDGEGVGAGVAGLTIDQRMSIANMTTEWGALAGLFPFDEVTRAYLMGRAEYFARRSRPGVRREGSLGGYTREDVERWWGEREGNLKFEISNADAKAVADAKAEAVAKAETGARGALAHEGGAPTSARGRGEVGGTGSPYSADAGAEYAIELEIDLSSVIPHVSGPNDVKTMVSLPEIEKRRVKVDKAWLMSCVNARYEDLAEAARIVKGKKVAPGVEFYLAAASAETQARAEREGVWAALVEAGAIVLPAGCGTCIGLGAGTIRAGEVGISATNRNFEGRMGDRAGQVYLGSPAVVAASAVAGYVCAAERYEETPLEARVLGRASRESRIENRGGEALTSPRRLGEVGGTEIIAGFPERVRGRMWFMDRDNLNTDGIYAGKHTYNDAMTKEQMAEVIFENYEPEFRNVVRAGDIVVGGLNFGTGSSREQAATALKHAGIACVIAASFSETYKRNAFNNGFVVFECAGLVEWLRRRHEGTEAQRHGGEKTRLVGEVEIDYRASVVRAGGREFAFSPLSVVAQELVVAGGAEEVVRRRLGTHN